MPGVATARQPSRLAPGIGAPEASRYIVLVAAAGAVSRKSMNTSRFVAARWATRNPPPPRLPQQGLVTASAKPTATAASIALPPWRRMSAPISAARRSAATTMPCSASTAGGDAARAGPGRKRGERESERDERTGHSDVLSLLRRDESVSLRAGRGRRALSRVFAKQVQRRRVGPTAAQVIDRRLEQRFARPGGAREQGHRRTKLEIVGRTENVDQRPPAVLQRRLDAFAQAGRQAADGRDRRAPRRASRCRRFAPSTSGRAHAVAGTRTTSNGCAYVRSRSRRARCRKHAPAPRRSAAGRMDRRQSCRRQV